MLSKEAEKFLLSLRLELMSHGKKDKDIQEIEEELRDHLREAEANGQSVESITGGSVKAYIRSISVELPRDKKFVKYSILLLIYLLGVFMIPDLISGDFELNTSVILYNLIVLVIGTAGTIILFKKIVRKYGDSKKTYISVTLFYFPYMAALVGAQFVIRNHPGIVLTESNFLVNLIIGTILLAIFIMVTLMMKQWFLAIFIFLMCLPSIPDIIAEFSTGSSSGADNETYLIISGIILIAVNITVIGMLIYTSKKEDKEASH
ncbi:hypothetical protein [Oceanobacillus jeddahense]|uniref:DUF1129 domain-containing protein n=1 Tax=Oceanobacillus jeddahense TaxID=1462527 RepID=A0ABY5JXP7_9BACI|nr:hypothetical protein [Oceanobacillus jeddahense]UUI03339.1 hypothetical protein NP439_01055 [Oceanobacillus jeddahense]